MDLQKKIKSSAARSKKIAAFTLIAACVVGIYFVKLVLEHSPNTASTQAVWARAKGNPKAPLRIVEFIDLQCPACAGGALILREAFKKHFNEIYLQVKYFPLPTVHKHSIRATIYAECAARQGKFWPLFDRLIDSQAQWQALLSAEPFFALLTQETGLDNGSFKQCLADEKIIDVMTKEKEEGRTLGVDRTPTYFINGKMVVGTKSLTEELDAFFAPKVK